jgi:hypothetical protein
MKKDSVAALKKKADTIHSTYIRLRDSDTNGYATCITCNDRKPYKTMQCGHFVSRRVNALRFDELNTNAQCVGCNMFKSGEQYAYSKALDMKYGDGTAESLWNRRFETHKLSIGELLAIIDERKQMVAELKEIKKL